MNVKAFFFQHWPAVTLTAALLLALGAAQIAIFNTPPMPTGELDARLAQLHQWQATAGDGK